MGRSGPLTRLKHREPNLPSRFTGILAKVRCADVCNVAVRPDQDPRSIGCDDLGRMTTAQMIEEPAAVVESAIGHSITRMQASDRDAGGKGARSVVQGQLVGRVAALDRARLEQAFAQT